MLEVWCSGYGSAGASAKPPSTAVPRSSGSNKGAIAPVGRKELSERHPVVIATGLALSLVVQGMAAPQVGQGVLVSLDLVARLVGTGSSRHLGLTVSGRRLRWDSRSAAAYRSARPRPVGARRPLAEPLRGRSERLRLSRFGHGIYAGRPRALIGARTFP